jgi:hypothetical protein
MSDRLVTVAVSLPGTSTRVLVPLKNAATRDPEAAAIAMVWSFSAVAPKAWRTEVVSSTPITDVPIQPENL